MDKQKKCQWDGFTESAGCILTKATGTFLLAKIHGKLCFPHEEVRQAIVGEWKHRTNADFYS